MLVEKTDIEGVMLLTPRRFEDARGFFSESWNRNVMAEHGFDYDWVQDNHSLSHKAGTIRGLHFQAPPHAQDKLVRCGRGAFFDVVVDIRRGSPTYGKWFGVELSAKNGRQLLIPAGFLHGFETLEPDTEICYKCTDYYAAQADGSVHWDSCGIDWRLTHDPVLSEKDASAVRFTDFESPFVWQEAAVSG